MRKQTSHHLYRLQPPEKAHFAMHHPDDPEGTVWGRADLRNPNGHV